jgi:hypothetical protein
MMSKHRVAMAAVIAVVLTGTAARDASARMRVDPCSLLTPAQIAAAIGATFGAGQAIGTTGCSWSASQEVGSKKPIVTVSLWPGSDWTKLQAPLPGVTKTSVSGVGDGAMFATMGQFTSFYVLKGSTIYLVKIYGIPAQDKQESMEQTLASDLLANT